MPDANGSPAGSARPKYDQQPMMPAQDPRFAEDTFKRERARVDKLGLARPSWTMAARPCRR